MILKLHDISLSLTPSEVVKGLDKEAKLKLFAELFENLSIEEITNLLKEYSWKLEEIE